MLFKDIPKNTSLILKASLPGKQLLIKCSIIGFIDEKTCKIKLYDIGDKPLNFKTVYVDFEYEDNNLINYIWKSVKIVYFNGEYILRVRTEHPVKKEKRDLFLELI